MNKKCYLSTKALLIMSFGVFGSSLIFLNIMEALHKNVTAANGIGYVPFDGYLAELHQGESVLDKILTITNKSKSFYGYCFYWC